MHSFLIENALRCISKPIYSKVEGTIMSPLDAEKDPIVCFYRILQTT